MDSKFEDRKNQLIIEPLGHKHLSAIKKWGLHDDPLLWEYNISKLNNLDLIYWLADRKKSVETSYFAVRDGKVMVGYFGFRDIDLKERSACLGIAIDPNYTSMGYGSLMMEYLLDYFFNEKKMSLLRLEVNSFNQRAINTYEKFKFRGTGQGMVRFAIKDKSLEILKDKRHFISKDRKIYSRTIKMELGRGDYYEV